ncbi:MAG TPA: leucine-rich repeat domain-containing protein, partial [Polyangiaceae bacterium]
MRHRLDASLVASIGLLCITACGSRSALENSLPIVERAVGGSGGIGNHSSANSAAGNGGTVSGKSLTAVPANGGVVTVGGAPAKGGAAQATGGAPANGGAAQATGGTAQSTGGGAHATGGASQATGGSSNCGPLIDDMEGATGFICTGEGRRGAWYAFNDGSSTQWPAPTTAGIPIPPSVIPGGRGSSQLAMHTYGTSARWSGIGVDLDFDGTTYGSYDARAYMGITFWARGSDITVRVSELDTTSTLYGGNCLLDTPPTGTGCQPHYRDLRLDSDWAQYWVPFSRLFPGIQADLRLDQLTNIQFYTGNTFDVWIDDVSFYSAQTGCCTPAPSGCDVTLSNMDQVLKAQLDPSTAGCADVCYLQSLSFDGASGHGKVTGLSGLQCLANLVSVSFNFNQVDDLGPLSQLTRLTSVSLANNQVSKLDAIAPLSRLQTLNLSGNQLEDIAPLSGKLRLTNVDLSDNRIDSLIGLSDSTKLTTLKLANNQISDVEPLRSLTALTLLDLANNQIGDIDALSHMTRMADINVANNRLSRIDALRSMTSLSYLDLSNNSIVDGSPLKGLTELISIKLSQNQLRDMTWLSNLSKLWSLDLSNNSITELQPLTSAKNFTYANLAGNRIREVSAWSALPNLLILDLSNNQVTDLGPFLDYVGLRSYQTTY